jgi:hypothetical protein
VAGDYPKSHDFGYEDYSFPGAPIADVPLTNLRTNAPARYAQDRRLLRLRANLPSNQSKCPQCEQGASRTGTVEGSAMVILPQMEQRFDSPSGVRDEMIMLRPWMTPT